MEEDSKIVLRYLQEFMLIMEGTISNYNERSGDGKYGWIAKKADESKRLEAIQQLRKSMEEDAKLETKGMSSTLSNIAMNKPPKILKIMKSADGKSELGWRE
ncbi:MAG: hypothetical protein ACTSUE_06350 [Promethearchaeota archaeon]